MRSLLDVIMQSKKITVDTIKQWKFEGYFEVLVPKSNSTILNCYLSFCTEMNSLGRSGMNRGDLRKQGFVNIC